MTHDLAPGPEGRLDAVGDRWQLSFVRVLPHPPERVWLAITEPEHLVAWFPTEIHGERSTGATLRFVFRDDEGPTFEGRMTRCEPPSVLEFEWGDDTLRFELEAVEDGTRLTLHDTFGEHGKAARDAAGWHTCLDALAFDLDGTSPPGTSDDRWQAVHPGYVERLGPEASTIGPPGR